MLPVLVCAVRISPQTCYISHLVTFQVLIPPPPPLPPPPPKLFLPKQGCSHQSLFTEFHSSVGCFHSLMEVGLQAPLSSVESLFMPSLLLVFQEQKSFSVAF